MTNQDTQSSKSDSIRPRRVAVVSAGTNEPSSTHLLAGRISERSLEYLRQMSCSASAHAVEIAQLAVELAQATVTGLVPENLWATIEQLSHADAIIACTPVYKAGIRGCSSRSSTCSTTTG
jgi:FMN reductase